MSKLWKAIQQHAQNMGDSPAILQYDKTLSTFYTWRELADNAQALAANLRADRIETLAVHGENGAQWIVLDVACDIAGVTLLPIPSFFSLGQVEHVLTTVSVDAVLSDNVQALECDVVTSMTKRGTLAGYDYLVPCTDSVEAADLLSIPVGTHKITFTSGSTGNPKGVCLSQAHMETVCDSLLAATRESDVARHLCVLPFSTLLENLAGIHTPLRHGAQVVVANQNALGFNGASGFSLPTLLTAISVCRPHSMVLIPQLLEALVLSCDAGMALPDSFRFIAVGGATVSHALLDRAWGYGIPAFEGYGLSECGSVVSLNSQNARRNGSLGTPLPHCQIEIDNDEIVVHGPVFLGYVGDTASWQKDAVHGTYRTGDLGVLEEDGYLRFLGRRKNLIVSSFGRNINPEWVEAEINLFPQVAQSFVFGDSRPYCVALIAAHTHEISDADIQKAVDAANARLPEFAQVKKWCRLSEPLPIGIGRELDLMTSNGRPRRPQIAAHFGQEIDMLYTSPNLQKKANREATENVL